MRRISAIMLVALAGCGTSVPGLGEADVTFPVSGDTLLAVTEDGVGSANYYGSIIADGSQVTLTGFDADTGDGWFTVSVDDQERPTELTLGTTKLTVTYNADGTFNYEVLDGGTVVYSGSNLQPEAADNAKCVDCLGARFGRLEIAACVEEDLENFADEIATYFSMRRIYVSNEVLRQCFHSDPRIGELARAHCVMKLILVYRVIKVDEDVRSGRVSGQNAARVTEAAHRALTKYRILWRPAFADIAEDIARNHGCMMNGVWTFVLGGSESCLTIEGGHMVREETPCGQHRVTTKTYMTQKSGNDVVIKWGAVHDDGDPGSITLIGAVQSDGTITGTALIAFDDSSRGEAVSAPFTMQRQ